MKDFPWPSCKPLFFEGKARKHVPFASSQASTVWTLRMLKGLEGLLEMSWTLNEYSRYVLLPFVSVSKVRYSVSQELHLGLAARGTMICGMILFTTC